MTRAKSETLVHASCVAFGERGVLLRGPSGSGKSDLALRLIDAGARLVADDQTRLRVVSGSLVADAPPALSGRLEVRGLGIVALPAVSQARVTLAVDLIDRAAIERLPPRQTWEVMGLSVPLLALDPFDVSAAAKLRLALRLGPNSIVNADVP